LIVVVTAVVPSNGIDIVVQRLHNSCFVHSRTRDGINATVPCFPVVIAIYDRRSPCIRCLVCIVHGNYDPFGVEYDTIVRTENGKLLIRLRKYIAGDLDRLGPTLSTVLTIDVVPACIGRLSPQIVIEITPPGPLLIQQMHPTVVDHGCDIGGGIRLIVNDNGRVAPLALAGRPKEKDINVIEVATGFASLAEEEKISIGRANDDGYPKDLIALTSCSHNL
jgi:hypothetical protein